MVAIHAVEDAPIPYLVMEYIPGKTLQQRLDEHGPLDLPDVLRLGKQIADGLAAAHGQDLIHRDIKPGNILLEGGMDERVKITDFGLARTADDASMTQSGMIAGTPMYMVPEQALGQKLDQRADLFSFGSVLYQMISGRPPFRTPTTMAVLKRVTERYRAADSGNHSRNARMDLQTGQPSACQEPLTTVLAQLERSVNCWTNVPLICRPGECRRSLIRRKQQTTRKKNCLRLIRNCSSRTAVSRVFRARC